MEQQKVRVRLPELYNYQQEISDHPARFKVLAIGRRAGKSYFAKLEALDRAINRGQQVWLVYPSYNTSSPHWREILRMVKDAPFTTYKNQQQRLLEFSSGGSISIKSADNYDNLRGSGLDFVVLDEAAFMAEEIFYDVVFPSIADKKGDVLIISTPNGRNWFYDVFRLGKDDKHPLWMSWQMKSTVNPIITKEDYELAKTVTPRMKFLREWDASFEGTGGGVFLDLDLVCVLEPLDEPEKDAHYVMGIDWGRKNDFTVISVFDRETGKQVHIYRFTDISYAFQSRKVIEVVKFWKPDIVYVEQNNIGDVMFESLKADMRKAMQSNPELGRIRIRPVYMTNNSKRDMVETYATRLENHQILLLSDSTAEGDAQATEHSIFALQKTASGQNITYAAPPKQHDDTVIAAMIATKGLRLRAKGISRFKVAPNKFYQ